MSHSPGHMPPVLYVTKSLVLQDPQPAAPQEQGVGSSAAASTMSHMPGMRAMRTVLGQRYDALFMDQMIASKAALLWSTWAWNIVMWEVQHRPHTAHPGNNPNCDYIVTL